ncbi:MAG: DUF188 domain-containing protein [Treponema sp.]|nr:DUF188 domain-containing protein [Treponema sp.]
MILWVDADSCPVPVRDMICRTGKRLELTVCYVANRDIPRDADAPVTMIIADTTPDAADEYIVENSAPGDLVITRDIPLARRLVDNQIRVINDRGTVYTDENIRERLAMRNLMLELYTSGLAPEKTGQFGKKELNNFANALDREITRLLKQSLPRPGNVPE